MANYYTNKLPVQEVSIEHLGENIRIILSEIFFIRDLNLIKPSESSSPIYKTTYTYNSNKNTIFAIEASINAFRSTIIEKKKKKGTLIVGFYKLVKKQRSLFGFKLESSYEKVYWEKWFIPYIMIDTKKLRNPKAVLDMQSKHLADIRAHICVLAMRNIDIVPDTINTLDNLDTKINTNTLNSPDTKINFDIKPSHDFNISFTFTEDEDSLFSSLSNVLTSSPMLSI